MASLDAGIAQLRRAFGRLPALGARPRPDSGHRRRRVRAAAHSRRRDAQPDDPGGSARRRPAQFRRRAGRRARGRRLLAARRAALLDHPARAADHGGPGRRAWRRRPRGDRGGAARDPGFHHSHGPRARRSARAGVADRRRHVDLRRLGGARGEGRDGRRRRGRRLCGRLRHRVRHAGDVRLSVGARAFCTCRRAPTACGPGRRFTKSPRPSRRRSRAAATPGNSEPSPS